MEVLDVEMDQSAASVLSQTTEEVARAAIEAAQSVRPSPSIVVSAKEPNNHNVQKWKRQLQKVWKWGSHSRESDHKSAFNPEVLASQKRQWYALHLQALERKQHKEPTCLFEHFLVVGLPSNANVDATEAAFAKRKTWETDMAKAVRLGDGRRYPYRGPPLPTLEPQILFKYPPGKRLAMRSKDLPAFCFPGDVKARLMERTPSMSDLNEVVYGQDHLNRDDLSFVFSLKVADNAPIYGICVYVQEVVQRPPGIVAMNSTTSDSLSSVSRFLVSAPRCYCILTKLPFFELHFEVLNSIIAQERLERITQFVNEMSLTDYVPPMVKVRERVNGKTSSPTKDDLDDWTASAIPVESVLGATAAAAGLISESKVSSFSSRASEPPSPESGITGEASEFNQGKEWDRDFKHTANLGDDSVSEASEGFSDNFDKVHDSVGNGHYMPENRMLSPSRPIERTPSSESLYSSIRSIDSEDDDVDEASSVQESSFGAEGIMEWAKTHNNELLQIICGYHSLPLPARGTDIAFRPLDHLPELKYHRPGELDLKQMGGRLSQIRPCKTGLEVAEVNSAFAAGEEALALSLWTVATVCRVLSLESVLTLVAGALLEKQIVIVCPTLGILSAVVLSLIPMIRPFEWQSLLLPVLPKKMLDFLDAPVPFIVGVQNKTNDVRSKVSNMIRVNVYKDQVKTCSMPSLPRQKDLASALEPIHAKLAMESESAGRHPVYKCNDMQAKAAEDFLAVLRAYLESFCSDLRSHTITNIQSNNDRVSLLLKDSFIDSFPSRDQPFIKLLVETQLFSVLTDAALSSYESD
uniref:UDENN domain-containing protein n=1 Tax=Araucaria cunninghamii TaxID=56994 RepID=A0A0D6R184_ARACU